MLAILPFVPIALKALFPPLRTALDLVFDVVSHFQPRYPASAKHVPEFPIRTAIRTRLAEVLKCFAARVKAAPDDE